MSSVEPRTGIGQRAGKWCKILITLLAVGHIQIAWSQTPSQFIPAEFAGSIPARLVYRAQGLVQAWNDPSARRAVVSDRIVIEEQFWRQQFAATGGVATISNALLNFTITGDPCESVNCSSGDFAAPERRNSAELNFSMMANAMLVGEDGLLAFHDVVLSDIAAESSYEYTPYQPYRSIGVGTGTWPTLAMAPNATLVLINVTLVYRNPAPLDTCEQYTQRSVFSLQQVFGAANITQFNATAGRVPGRLRIPVVVKNGSTNDTLGEAQVYIRNATFHCIPRLPAQPGGGLSPGVLAAAVVVPVVVVLLLAGLLAWLCVRRRRRARRTAVRAADRKDIESGQPGSWQLTDVGGTSRDQQQRPDDDRDTVVPLGAFPVSTTTSQSRSTTSYSSSYPGSGASAATSSSSMAPAIGGGTGSPAPAAAAATGPSGSGSTYGIPTPMAAAAARGMPAPASSSQASPVAPLPYRTPGPLQPAGRSGSAAIRSSIDTTILGVRDTSSGEDTGAGSGQAMLTSSPAAAASGSSGGGASGAGTSGGASGGVPGSAGDAGMHSSSRSGLNRSSGVPALIKARSDMIVLRDLKIGPLLGRGSYGRVYKGRWKAVTVAVKIIEHSEGSPGTASSGGKRINIGRESLLATNMAHPNVVQTYHISTMTASQRNALANSCLTDKPGSERSSSGKLNQRTRRQSVTQDADGDSQSSQSSDGEQKDVLETWMLMEYCEKGSLDRAVSRGKFIRREDQQPEMIGIYKALLDTASGLDYLHSIGVVHGDLKTANVLLKGSTRDVRGFACKITDFGLSRVLDLDATHISTRTYGTIVYMPSELLLTGRMTPATDIYSFGLMMWELFTSQRVFEEGLSIGQIFYMIAYQSWRPAVPPHCPPGYAQLMTACWHQEPEQRPTVQQLLRSLQKLYVAEKQRLAALRREAAGAEAAQDRTSFESTASDRYRNAADAASEAAAAVGAAEAAAKAEAEAEAEEAEAEAAAVAAVVADSPVFHSPDTMVAVPGGHVQLGSYHGPYQGQPDGLAASGTGSGGSGQESRRDRRETSGRDTAAAAVAAAATHAASRAQQQQQQGSDGGGPSSEGTDGHEEYLPWAHAVSQQSGSVLSEAAARQQSFAGVSRAASGQQLQLQQQQQQAIEGCSWQEQDGAAEIEPVDNEGMPSESLYPVSSSNALFGNTANYEDLYPDDDGGGEVTGFLQTVHQGVVQGYRQQHGYQQPPVNSSAAHGFVEAIEMVARPGAAAGGAGGGAAGYTGPARQPYFQQQQYRPAVNMTMPSVQPSVSGGSFLQGEWSSVSTGTMPPVMADGSSLTLMPSSVISGLSSSSVDGGPGSRVYSRNSMGTVQSGSYSRPGGNSGSAGRTSAWMGEGGAASAAPLTEPAGWFARDGGGNGTGGVLTIGGRGGPGAAASATASATGSGSGSAGGNTGASTLSVAPAGSPAGPGDDGPGRDSGSSIRSGLLKLFKGKRQQPPAAAAAAPPSTPSTSISSAPIPLQLPPQAAAMTVPGYAAPGAAAAAAAPPGAAVAAASGSTAAVGQVPERGRPTSYMPAGGAGAAGGAAGVAYPTTSTGMLQTVVESPPGQAGGGSEPVSHTGSGLQEQVSNAPPPSPFAALAQRAGSLFGPM